MDRKEGELFNVTMNAYNGVKICDLVGLSIL